MTEEQFVVGGCVRDVLLGLEPRDIDYVWVNSSVEQMLSRGFTQVGLSFPVFLDSNGDEHALARTEVKTGLGYNNFECITEQVTLVQDLSRRDLTINSMAVKLSDWEVFKSTKQISLLIDPFGGYHDLINHRLKHTSVAFAEDPIRVLRTARFVARYQFSIDPTTLNLMRIVVPELNNVSTDRISVELIKGLSESNGVLMLTSLFDCGAFDVLSMQPYQIFNKAEIAWCDQHGFDVIIKLSLIGNIQHLFDVKSTKLPSDVVNMQHFLSVNRQHLRNYSTAPPDIKLMLIKQSKALTKSGVATLVDQMISAITHCQLDDMFQADVVTVSKVKADKYVEAGYTGIDVGRMVTDDVLAALANV